MPEGTLTRSQCQRDSNHFLHDLYSLLSRKLLWPVSDNEANMSSFKRRKFKGRIKMYWTAYCTSCSWSDRTITPISAIFSTCSEKKHRWQSTSLGHRYPNFKRRLRWALPILWTQKDFRYYLLRRGKTTPEIFLRWKARPHHSFSKLKYRSDISCLKLLFLLWERQVISQMVFITSSDI